MNKTSEIFISNAEDNASEALKTTDEFINAQGLERKKAIHLRLIVEEMIGMIRAMAGDFRAKFWIEKDGDVCLVKLMAKTEMDRSKKEELLSVSRSGKNAAATGFMGKIKEIVENGLLDFDEVMKLQQEYSGGSVNYAMIGCGMSGELPMMGEPLTWSLGSYKEGLASSNDEEEPVREAWDELEKSIVASIAEDVVVGVKKDRVDMTISMKM